jgi:peptide/nickel transport system substrate-binding protein
MRRCPPIALSFALAILPAILRAQASSRDALVIATGEEVALPVPTLTSSAEATRVADLLFLHLGRFAGTSHGDKAAVPELASRWTRTDDRTLVFELDPRARWHDGTPVTTRDVLFSFERARNPKLVPTLARLLREVESVTADGDRRFTIRFARAYPEQLYDATYHVLPLPAHLLGSVPPDSLAASAFAQQPVGNGPYRYVRRVPAQFTEIEAVPDFFLGRPTVPRIIFRYATEHEARLNLVLSGEADVVEDLVPPVSEVPRLSARPDLRIARLPSMSVAFIWFNQRSPGDTARAHPLLTDRELRRALVLGLDRVTLTRAIYGEYAKVPSVPVATASWVSPFAPAAPPYRPDEARKILAARGFVDRDGDGILEKDGRPLALTLIVPTSSLARRLAATIAQEQYRRLGIDVQVKALEFRAFAAAARSGEFDLAVDQRFQDPSPFGMTNTWTCGGAPQSNLGRFCNARVDSLLARARTEGDPKHTWQLLLAALADDYPAAVLFSRENAFPLPKRFTKVDLHPESLWRMAWTWSGPSVPR